MIKDIFVILAAVFCIFAYVRVLEMRSLYVPFRDIYGTPQTLGLSFDDLFINTPDRQRLNAWFIPHERAKYTIYYLHGNGGNLSHRLAQISLLHELNLNVFIIDYRGYGLSSGSPSEKGLYADARAAYGYLTKELKVPPERVILFGESLGSSVCVNLAQDHKVRAMILTGAFTSSADMARKLFRVFPTFFLSSKFDALSKIGSVCEPKLFIHSENDEIVPIDLAKKLFDAAAGPKEFFVIRGGHNDALLNEREALKERIRDFIDVHVDRQEVRS